jgi:NAD(P)-dependent dehydrogenase (short-subunit alcohol dehydrogenase family)
MTGGGGRVALVTGAARGIGAATARRFEAGGYHVVGADVIEREAVPGVADAWPLESCDVADEAAVAELVARVAERHGGIDVLVNVAGIVLVKPLEETSWDEFMRVANVNIGGTFLLCKHVIPVMKRRGGGAIVNVGSVSGHVGQVDHALYGATKAAVIGMCRALAWELAPHKIRVNSVSPGSVDTAMLRGDIALESERTGSPYGDVKKLREGEQAFGRWADPSEIAEAVYFMASAEASFVTGSDLLVDCGWTAR